METKKTGLLKNVLRDAISVSIMGFVNKMIAEMTKAETKKPTLLIIYFVIDRMGSKFSKYINVDYLRCNILERAMQTLATDYSIPGASYIQGETDMLIQGLDDAFLINGDDFTIQASDDREIRIID